MPCLLTFCHVITHNYSRCVSRHRRFLISSIQRKSSTAFFWPPQLERQLNVNSALTQGNSKPARHTASCQLQIEMRLEVSFYYLAITDVSL